MQWLLQRESVDIPGMSFAMGLYSRPTLERVGGLLELRKEEKWQQILWATMTFRNLDGLKVSLSLLVMVSLSLLVMVSLSFEFD